MLNKLKKLEEFGFQWLLRSSDKHTDTHGNDGYFINLGFNRLVNVFPGIAIQKDTVFKGYSKDVEELVTRAAEHAKQFIPKDKLDTYLAGEQDVGVASWQKKDTVKVDGHFKAWRIMMDHHNVETYLVGYLDELTSEINTDAIEYVDLVAGLVKTKTKVYSIATKIPHRM